MENVLEYITLYAPVIIAILGEIGVVAGIIAKVTSYFKKANAAIEQLKESAEYTELKHEIKNVMKENKELKIKLNTVLEKLTHVKVQDETISNNKEK